MHELNQQDNAVIVGRAGQVILREEDNVLHVRLFAPLELRALRIAQTHRIKLEVARKQVKISDQARVRYMKRYYNTRWDDPNLYDIMINTAHLTAYTAAHIVCKAVEQREHLPDLHGGESLD
jgi:cytidylate kinase